MQSIGLMSGTSVDGLDVCCATFEMDRGKWTFHVDCSAGYPYPPDLREKLRNGVQNMSALEFAAFHSEYGMYLGDCVNEFIRSFKVKPDIISSHGSTVFHEPDKKIMFQIGDGAAIAARTGIPTVSDFCLNIGGFSNISYRKRTKRIAYDISPVNYVINRLCSNIGLEMDRDGLIAYGGKTDADLLASLNSLEYYSQPYPKSLSREWVEKNVFPLLGRCTLPLKDILRTYYEHCAFQFARAVKPGKRVLVTGGGAWNKFLITRMEALSDCNLVIPDRGIVDFKEALVFAFLGVLYMMDIPSCLKSATGASRDNIGGMLFKV